MKLLKLILMCLAVQMLFAGAALASCEETAEAARQAAAQRNEDVGGLWEIGLPNPEDYRAAFGSCLSIINKVGLVYNMGVSIPDLTAILTQICDMVSAEINKRINSVLNQVNTEIWKINRYTVSGNYLSLADEVLKRINK